MIFSERDIYNALKNSIADKLLNKNTFKGELKDILEEPMVIKRINNIEFSYGYDNFLGSYFILKDENYEGFILISKSYKTNGTYFTEEFLINTPNYEFMKSVQNKFHTDKIRQVYINEIITKEIEEQDENIETVYAYLKFDSLYKVRRDIKPKYLSLFKFWISMEGENIPDINKLKLNGIMEPLNVRFGEIPINLFAAIVISKNIEYLIKNEISYDLLMEQLKEYKEEHYNDLPF